MNDSRQPVIFKAHIPKYDARPSDSSLLFPSKKVQQYIFKSYLDP